MRNLFDKVLETIKDTNFERFYELLENNTLTPSQLSNEVNFNIFHCLADNLVTEKCALTFVDKAQDIFIYSKNGGMAKVLLNLPFNIEDKCTPLHLAIIRGRTKLAKRYLELGADPSIKNELGRNSVHLCAEAGYLGLFMTLQNDYKKELEIEDKKNLTPLHLAIGQRHEDMALLIISLSRGLKINFTSALEMAVNTGSYRITRHLLLNRQKDSFDLEEVQKRCEDKEILKLLKNGKKTEKSNKYLGLLVFGIILKETCRFYQLYYINQLNFAIIEGCIQLGILMCTLICLFLVSIKNPGYENKKSKISLKDLYSKYLPEFICPYCELKKHKETRHCMVCKRCVLQYDHHCRWVNNCIGESNYKYFLGFLLFLLIDIIVDLVFYGYNVFLQGISNKARLYQAGDEDVIEFLFVLGLLINIIQGIMVLPIFFKQVLKLKHFCKRKKDVKKIRQQVSLEYSDYSKSFKNLENEETSDTTSMFIQESMGSQLESDTSSNSFLSQFSHRGK